MEELIKNTEAIVKNSTYTFSSSIFFFFVNLFFLFFTQCHNNFLCRLAALKIEKRTKNKNGKPYYSVKI